MRDAMKPERVNGIDDYLGLAATAAQKGREAVESGNYDDAWYYFHQQQAAYTRHINSPLGDFSRIQALVLLSTANMQFANILRLESKHREALVHIIYWYACAAASNRITKSIEASLKSYVKRCEYQNTGLEAVRELANNEALSIPDITRIQTAVMAWD